MKKTLSIVLSLIISLGMITGCSTDSPSATSSATPVNNANNSNIVQPLPETLGIDKLDNCTVAVSLEKGNAYVDDSGKIVIKVKVYNYEVYDMLDIASLKENDIIVRRNEEIKISKLKRLDSGLVSINGGEENGGFDLISNDNTVYYETGMNDIKAYYELGEATLPVSDEFEYTDESDIDNEPKNYYPGDFLTDDSGIEYNFSPNNTSIVIESGTITKMNKVYMP